MYCLQNRNKLAVSEMNACYACSAYRAATQQHDRHTDTPFRHSAQNTLPIGSRVGNDQYCHGELHTAGLSLH